MLIRFTFFFGVFLIIAPLVYYRFAPFSIAKLTLEPMTYIFMTGMIISFVSGVLFVAELIAGKKIYTKIKHKELIKPCPFCGAKVIKDNIYVNHEGKEFCNIKCVNFYCKINPQTAHLPTDEAINIWNNRN